MATTFGFKTSRMKSMDEQIESCDHISLQKISEFDLIASDVVTLRLDSNRTCP
jgi:hypothetical protein